MAQTPPEGQPEREPRPRGRAAAEIRTGRWIKEWLERVGESSIAEAHQGLMSEIGRHNAVRPRREWLRAPTYHSFYAYFWRLRQWRLVEWVRDEPTEYVPHDRLLSIRMTGSWSDAQLPPTQVVRSTRRVFRLSELGKRPEMDFLWDDPMARGVLRAALAGQVPRPPSQ